MQFFGCHHGKAPGEIESGLPAENRTRSRAGAVGFIVPRVKDVAHQVKILLHKDRLAVRLEGDFTFTAQ